MTNFITKVCKECGMIFVPDKKETTCNTCLKLKWLEFQRETEGEHETRN